MPKTKKRVLDVELDLNLNLAVVKRLEVSPDGSINPGTAFPEIKALLRAAARPPLSTKGVVVLKFAYGEVEVEREETTTFRG